MSVTLCKSPELRWLQAASSLPALCSLSLRFSRACTALVRASSASSFFASARASAARFWEMDSSISFKLRSFARRFAEFSLREPPVMEPVVEMTSPSRVTILNARGYFLAIAVAERMSSQMSVLPRRLCITFSYFLS